MTQFGGFIYGKGNWGSCMKENDSVKVKDGVDVNSIIRDMMSAILEGALNEELDEDLS